MKIVFKDSIFDVIVKRINDAKRANKKIDYILVAEMEYSEMRGDYEFHSYCGYNIDPCSNINHNTIRNEAFRTIQLPDPDRRDHPYMKFASHLTFQDIAVYVVPARFM